MKPTMWRLARHLLTQRSIVRIHSHVVAIVLLLGLGKAQAAADDPPAEIARAQFAHGLDLASKGDYQAALQVFNEAYSASPHFAVLYNMGQAQVALGRPLEAAATLLRYLREGQDNVPAERRRQVEEQIKLLDSFLIDLEVTVDSPAAISVDGHEVGRTPLPEPVRLTAGTHKITASIDRAIPSDITSAAPANPQVGRSSCDSTDVAGQLQGPLKPVAGRSGVRSALPYVLAGAGVALGAGALGVYLWKRGDYEQWQAGQTALQKETPGSASYQARATENQRLAASLTTANHTILGLSVAGAVLVAAGTSLYLIDWASARKSAPLTIAWSGGSSVAAGWRWAW